MASLPEDITEEVLSKVRSAKSLLRFKCVSKSWCSLISSKRFAKTHLQNSIKRLIPFSDGDIIEHKFMKLNWQRKLWSGIVTRMPYFITSMDLEFTEVELAAELLFDEYAYLDTDRSNLFVGYNNGLSCVRIKEKIYLWNPCTRQHNLLPSSEFDWPIMSLGFGFDAFNDDYKVFAQLLTSDKDGFYIKRKYVITVYSLKSNSWKILKKIDERWSLDKKSIDKLLAQPIDISGKLLNGKLHWGSSEGMGGSQWFIVSFELSSEVFGIVEQPSYLGDERRTNDSLEVVKECLCIHATQALGGPWSDVWIMKEYGVKESWYKAFRFCSTHEIPNYPGFKPWYITEELEILYKDKKGIPIVSTNYLERLYKEQEGTTTISYDPRTNTVRHPRTSKSSNLQKGELRIQSLVSPFPEGGQ